MGKELKRTTIADKESTKEWGTEGVNDSRWSKEERKTGVCDSRWRKEEWVKTIKVHVAEEEGDLGKLVSFGFLNKLAEITSGVVLLFGCLGDKNGTISFYCIILCSVTMFIIFKKRQISLIKAIILSV